jgi:NAD(P)H-dependent flavin oxidoreductase YrpB (nitropropane dioxygenase family)
MTPTIHTEGRIDLMANYAGQGVGLVREILPAAEIVERMVFEAEAILRRLSSGLA